MYSLGMKTTPYGLLRMTGNYWVVWEHKVSKLTLYSGPIETSQMIKKSDIIKREPTYHRELNGVNL